MNTNFLNHFVKNSVKQQILQKDFNKLFLLKFGKVWRKFGTHVYSSEFFL